MTVSYIRTIEAWIENLKQLDQRQYKLVGSYIKYLEFALEGFGYTTGQYCIRCTKMIDRSLKDKKNEILSQTLSNFQGVLQ